MSLSVWRIALKFVCVCTDVNVAFQQAAHKVLLDDDSLLPLLHLTVDYQGKDSKGNRSSPSRPLVSFSGFLAPSGGFMIK